MTRTILSVLVIVFVPLISLLAEDVKSGWATVPMTIDGDGDEWRDRGFTYFDEDKTAIAIMNDSAEIYLIVISRDEGTVMQMERSGIVVWLNGDGKKKKDYGLRYRAGRLSKEPRRTPEGFEPPADMAERREKMEEEQARLRRVITIIENKKSEEISAKGDQGPAAAATYGKEIYAIEFKIPILAPGAEGNGLSRKEAGQIMLGIETGYRTEAEKNEMRERMERPEGEGMRIGMGGGGTPPSGGGGMGGHGGPGGMRHDQGKKEFWLKVDLAAGS
jgi:hypothetical protein